MYSNLLLSMILLSLAPETLNEFNYKAGCLGKALIEDPSDYWYYDSDKERDETIYPVLPPADQCSNGAIVEKRGFLKCERETAKGKQLQCHNTEQIYEVETERGIWGGVSWLCSHDPKFYQLCGIENDVSIKAGNRKFDVEGSLCGGIVCLKNKRRKRMKNHYLIYSYGDMKHHNFNDGCTNTDAYKNLPKSVECDDICAKNNACTDEIYCNGHFYGLPCNGCILPPYYICNGFPECPGGEDEENCTITSDTPMCLVWQSERIIPDSGRCDARVTAAEYMITHSDLRFCNNYMEQTNCSDPHRVGVRCSVGGYKSTVSKYMVCWDKNPLCDDNFENLCIRSPACTFHRHKMCDGEKDCIGGIDENDLVCRDMTIRKCQRRVGPYRELAIPVAWLGDGIEDCENGEDEQPIWPTCGADKTLRKVAEDTICHEVYVCLWGEPGYVQLDELCDGIDTCGRENSVCSKSQNLNELFVSVQTTNNRLTKTLSYCMAKGTPFPDTCTTIDSFIFPDHHFFGVSTRTRVVLPAKQQNCDSMFGEQYVYTSCNNMCINSPCPLRNYPLYGDCPYQLADRVGTIANNDYLTFFTKSREGLYTNRFFVCGSRLKCIDYFQVCDLVDDCGDGSDENLCTNHFQCEASKRYIPKVKQCDEKFDCPDLSDECNSQCSKEILQGSELKTAAWIIGISAVVANLIAMSMNIKTVTNCRTSVAMVNKLLVITICLGDLLVGFYLVAISIFDSIIFGKDYCKSQTLWITSFECSALGVLSTMGMQASLFAMCALSLVRVRGILRSMHIPGEATWRTVLQIAGGVMLIMFSSTVIAVAPIIGKFEDFFVNGLRFNDDLKLFIGTVDKKKLMEISAAYYGRMRRGELSWIGMRKLVDGMFSHTIDDIDDELFNMPKNDFYGNDGVCLFKYFVKGDDPQKLFVWVTLAINLTCFVVITVSYAMIGIVSVRSSSNLTATGRNRQVEARDRRMNLRIAIIILTDFICWVPFIVVCMLHAVEAIDATSLYSLFSIIILPINSVINPLIYDTTVTEGILNPVRTVVRKMRPSFLSYRSRLASLMKSDEIELPARSQDRK